MAKVLSATRSNSLIFKINPKIAGININSAYDQKLPENRLAQSSSE